MSDSEEIEIPDATAAAAAVFRPLSLDSHAGLIYHYCSADTLLAILKNRSLRFGEASRMNDGEEIVWAEKQFEIAIKRLHDRNDIPDEIPVVPRKFLDTLQKQYGKCAGRSRQFLACFSTSGDSLSQWRAYADDAKGFSIGFDPDCLEIPAPSSLVEYDPDRQQDYIMRAIAAISEASKAPKYDEVNLDVDALMLYQKMISFKNPAFVDEREVRASHIALLWEEENGSLALNYCGGIVGDKSINEGEIEFRCGGGSIIPYIDFKFKVDDDCAVKEIWIGPRCPNNKLDIEILLGTLGFENVKVEVAGAKYRG